MNSKEALERLRKIRIYEKESSCYDYLGKHIFKEEIEALEQDLDRLEKLEKDYEKLKERYKHRAETSKDLCNAVKQYEKAIEILKEHNLQVYHIPDFTTPYLSLNDYGDGSSISIKEYKLLKEVLGNE